MTKDYGAQFSFSSGELSKNMWARFDLAQYKSGCERVNNFIIHPQGSASYREGFTLSCETADNKIALLHKFHFKNQYYIFEFTDKLVRVHEQKGVIVTDNDLIFSISRTGNTVTFTRSLVGATYPVGSAVLFERLTGCTELNNRIVRIDSVVGGVHTATIEGTWTTNVPYGGDGVVARVVELETLFEEKDLFELQFAQTSVDLYIAHYLYNPVVLRYDPRFGSLSSFLFTPTNGLTFSEDNYPTAVLFYESRLFFAGTITEPQTIWGSKPGKRLEFETGGNIDDGVKYTLSSSEASVIKFLSSTSKLLIIGTSGGIFGATTATPTTSFEVRPIDGFACEGINPILKNNSVLSVQAGGRKLRSLTYSFQTEGYASSDLNIVSEDITEGGIKQISYMEGSPEVVWCVKKTGELIGLTYKPEVSVYAWHRHNLATGDKILSADSLTREGDYEQLWVVVEREIDGRISRTIEKMADSLDYPVEEDFYTERANRQSDIENFRRTLLEKQKGYIHVDGALSYDGSDLIINRDKDLILSDTTGDITIQSSPGGAFLYAEIGQQVWQKNITGNETGRAVITSKIGSSEVNCTVLTDFSSTSINATEWYLTTDKLDSINHLDGREVTIVADGAVHPNRTVVDGRIELANQASVIHVGLSYTGLLKTTDINSIQYFSQTKPKNAYRFAIKLLDAIGLSYGTNIYTTEKLPFRSTDSFLDNPPDLYTGTKIVAHSGNWHDEKNIILLQEQSLPCTILMVVTYMLLGER